MLHIHFKNVSLCIFNLYVESDYFINSTDLLVPDTCSINFKVNECKICCSKKDPELLNKILPCLQILLQDDNVNVQKKVILSLPQVYKVIVKVS